LDLVKIHALRPDPYEAINHFRPILEQVKQSGLAIEASTAGWRKTVKEQYPDLALLRLANEMQIPITIASDAHSHVQIAENYPLLARILEHAEVKKIVRFSKHRPTT
jgi:histidinol-phosphatase (PHP family)